jgi:hypothetical protein
MLSNISTDDFSRYGLGHNFAATEGQNLQAEINRAARFEEALMRAQEKHDSEALMSACKEFETYFINMTFKEMRKTVHRRRQPHPPFVCRGLFSGKFRRTIQ